MTDRDLKIQAERVAAFHRLSERAAAIRKVLAEMGHPKVQDSGPFTGNTRESRRVDSLRIFFSPTLGRAPAVDIMLTDLGIQAYPFGRWLEEQLKSQLTEIQAEIEKL